MVGEDVEQHGRHATQFRVQAAHAGRDAGQPVAHRIHAPVQANPGLQVFRQRFRHRALDEVSDEAAGHEAFVGVTEQAVRQEVHSGPPAGRLASSRWRAT